MNTIPAVVDVYLDAPELAPRLRVGTLRRVDTKVDSPIAFGYDPEWIGAREFFLLDPTHYPTQGDQYPPRSVLAGIFTDTTPDRWGRILLDTREVMNARKQDRRPRSLGEWDYLLGVNDLLRMGALRYAEPMSGVFLDDDRMAVPPITDLRTLEEGAREMERPRGRREPPLSDALRMLLAPGSPLGGARPKASFDIGGQIWLAKFPSQNDQRDVGAWEYVLNRLAQRAHIEVPDVDSRQFGVSAHTFLAKRFDRDQRGRRLYASAMTLVGKRDRDPAGYLDIVEAIERYGAPTFISEDLRQLFVRVIFNIATAHRDDHLRNHGFIRTADGWRLAPAFDLNPTPEKSEHELAIGFESREPDLEVATSEIGPLCRLRQDDARRLVAQVLATVATWAEVAREAGIPRNEMDLVGSEFRVSN